MTRLIRDYFLDLYPRLREQLVRRLGSRDLAEDALNETYFKVDRLGDAAAIRNPESYLFRMALNTATDQHRRGARFATTLDVEAAMAIPDPLADPLRALEGRIAVDIVARAVEALPARQRQILEMVRLEGKSCGEVAATMNLSRRTVEIEVRRALDACRKELKDGGFDFATRHDRASLQ